GRVRWAPEPPGEESFDHAGIVLQRGDGDCDDIGPWEAASMRLSGYDPGARSVAVRSGPKKWHAVVQQSDGSMRDPSQEAGMTVSGIGGALVAPLMDGSDRPSIAVMPSTGFWRARADLPWRGGAQGVALVGYGAAASPAAAMRDAMNGVCFVGQAAGVSDRDHCANLLAIEAMLRGVPAAQLQAVFAAQGYSFT